MRRNLIILLLVAFGAPAYAQDETHWGISSTMVPQWEFLDFLEDSMDRSIEMRGTDVQIGIVRGRQLGGEWGASFIMRRIDDDSTSVQEHPRCFARAGQPDVCAGGTSHRTRQASLRGVQFHRFFPVTTVARRIQLGVVLAGGVARVRGQADETQEHLQITVNAITGATSLSVASETATVEAREIFDDMLVAEYLPMGGVEGAIAIALAPGLKVRLSGGANFPGFHRFAVTAQYLFGSR